jgi:hypothetical protein
LTLRNSRARIAAMTLMAGSSQGLGWAVFVGGLALHPCIVPLGNQVRKRSG